MKRSEALQKLEQHLADECGLDFLGMSPKHVAQEVLMLVESLGMLPPYKDGEEPFGHNGLELVAEWED
jgi:hypothetical protein